MLIKDAPNRYVAPVMAIDAATTPIMQCDAVIKGNWQIALFGKGTIYWSNDDDRGRGHVNGVYIVDWISEKKTFPKISRGDRWVNAHLYQPIHERKFERNNGNECRAEYYWIDDHKGDGLQFITNHKVGGGGASAGFAQMRPYSCMCLAATQQFRYGIDDIRFRLWKVLMQMLDRHEQHFYNLKFRANDWMRIATMFSLGSRHVPDGLSDSLIEQAVFHNVLLPDEGDFLRRMQGHWLLMSAQENRRKPFFIDFELGTSCCLTRIKERDFTVDEFVLLHPPPPQGLVEEWQALRESSHNRYCEKVAAIAHVLDEEISSVQKGIHDHQRHTEEESWMLNVFRLFNLYVYFGRPFLMQNEQVKKKVLENLETFSSTRGFDYDWFHSALVLCPEQHNEMR